MAHCHLLGHCLPGSTRPNIAPSFGIRRQVLHEDEAAAALLIQLLRLMLHQHCQMGIRLRAGDLYRHKNLPFQPAENAIHCDLRTGRMRFLLQGNDEALQSRQLMLIQLGPQSVIVIHQSTNLLPVTGDGPSKLARMSWHRRLLKMTIQQDRC